jgi:hypothetical protein
MKFMFSDNNNFIIILLMFVENIGLCIIKSNLYNDLLLYISYLFSNFHYLEGSLIDSNIHSIMENDLTKPNLMNRSGNEGDPNSEPSNNGNNSGSDMQDSDEEEEDDVDVENIMDNVEDLLDEAKVTRDDCEELEKAIAKVSDDPDPMDDIISDTDKSKSLKRSRDDDSDDEVPARKVSKHMEGSMSENITHLENKRNALREIDESLDIALNEMGDVYKNTKYDSTKEQILNFLDSRDIPQEKKDEVTSNEYSAWVKGSRGDEPQ